MLRDQYGYPLHPVYSFSPWHELSTLSKLIFYGLAAETFGIPLFVTCSISLALTERLRDGCEAPSSIINRQFRNHGLGHILRVGILEFGRKLNGHHRHKHRSEGEDRLHVHMVIDRSCWDGSEHDLLQEIERCFRFGRGDTPAHDGHVIAAKPVTFDTPSQPSSIYRLAERGAVGCLVYAALQAKRTLVFLGRAKPSSPRWEARFHQFKGIIKSRHPSSALRFNDIIFVDRRTSKLARTIHASPSTPDQLVRRANDISEEMYDLRLMTEEDFLPDDPNFAQPVWQRRPSNPRERYGL